MSNLKRFGVLLTSTALTFGIFSSSANASTTVIEQSEKVRIQIASTESVITKNDLIQRFRSLFPNRFDFVKTGDFHMDSGHHFPDDDTLRYALSFSKIVDGKRVYGHVGFVGEDLEIEYFSYQPHNVAEALFPAKVSKNEAKKIALDFAKNFQDGGDFQFETDSFNYFPKRLLTEPIRYSFSFTRMKNQVAIADQGMNISVLGNGEIVEFYRHPMQKNSSTFDDVKKLKDKNEMVNKVKENLSVDLRYQLDADYQTGERSVQLVYQPTTKLRGLHASTGEWLTANGYATDFTKKTKTEKITANPLPPKQDGVSLEEARKIAEQFLSIKSDKVKLTIQAIEEVDNHYGQEVIRIQYMYHYANGGSGTSMEINKHTGEVIQYQDMTSQLLEQIGEKPKAEKTISQKEALSQAIKYVKEWVPSYVHDYAMPIDEAHFEETVGAYHFSFPRIVNGLIVMGDQISVNIAADGSLYGLTVNYQEVESWPSVDKVISEEKAQAIFEEALSLKLNYMKHSEKEGKNHYDLVYLPVYNNASFSFLDAHTGEWNNFYNEGNPTVISHPWAEDELNYLINAKILDVKDPEKFNGDAPVSKGDAIKIIMNSLTYFYDGMYYGRNDQLNQTFDTIDPKHPLFQQLERAVEMGIIKADNQSFDLDSPIKREELAAWYIRALGLEQAAKQSTIFKLDFADANKVKAENTGYVALANSIGLVKTDQNHFYPDRAVTYAELAVSTIRLAHELLESGKSLNE